MSSIKQLYYQTSCHKKIRYARPDEAEEVAERMNRENKESGKGSGDRMEAYRCAFCKGYHVGHELERDKKIKRSVKDKEKSFW